MDGVNPKGVLSRINGTKIRRETNEHDNSQRRGVGFRRSPHGIITKVTVTPANVHDGKGLKHVAPKQGAVLADKIYSDGPAQKEIKRRGLHSMVIKKNNNKDKNHRKDSYFSSLRVLPTKESIVTNLKRLTMI